MTQEQPSRLDCIEVGLERVISRFDQVVETQPQIHAPDKPVGFLTSSDSNQTRSTYRKG